jgi:hypothetical protein
MKSQGIGQEIRPGTGIGWAARRDMVIIRIAGQRAAPRRRLRPRGLRNQGCTRETPSASVTPIRCSLQGRFPPWKRQLRIPPRKLGTGHQVAVDDGLPVSGPMPALALPDPRGSGVALRKCLGDPQGGETRRCTTRCGLHRGNHRACFGVGADFPSTTSHGHFCLLGQTPIKEGLQGCSHQRPTSRSVADAIVP